MYRILRVAVGIVVVGSWIAGLSAQAAQVTVYQFPMDTDPGWSLSGEWAFGVPQGLGGVFAGSPDPTAGATGNSVCGIDLAGDYSAVIAGPAYLTTTALNFTGYEGVTVQFQRWLNTDNQPYVRSTFEASNDGVHWTMLWQNGSAPSTDSAWTPIQHDLAVLADNKPTVYVRWGHEVLDAGAIPYSGWNIDDVVFLAEPKDDLRVTPLDDFTASGPAGGPFTPACKTYTLTNDGGAPVNWTVATPAAWLDLTPSSGTLNPQESVNVNVCFNAAANALGAGWHSAAVTFTNIGSGREKTRNVSLNVTSAQPARAFYWFPLDSDPGWTTEGQWQFGVPTGGGSYCHDPRAGHTGSTIYGYNLSGDYPNSMPAYHLTTRRLNCSTYEHVKLGFWRWLGIESASFDHGSVEVSRNGTDWVTVWSHTSGSFCDGKWVYVEYDVSSVADRQPSVYMRWTMGPTDSSVTYPGMNIDDIALLGDRVDDLSVTTTEDFLSTGKETGPFAPSCKDYKLVNVGSQPVNWTASADAGWLDVTPASGTLVPEQWINVDVCVNAVANSLTRGTYTAMVTFCNPATSVCHIRNVTLIVDPYPAEITVTDSIDPANDLKMPFGNVFVGVNRTEHITITNSDPDHDLVVSNISLGGRYAEDFNDGQAQNWHEDVNADWTVVSSQYRAMNTSLDTWMMATYTGAEWDDLSVQADLHREGYTGTSAAIVLRASADMDDGVGSGYIFQIATCCNAYGVWKQVNGQWSWLQSWTTSSQVRTDTNTLTAIAQGNALTFAINGVVVWTGTDSSLTSGRIGLGGYTAVSDPTTHYFDNVLVGGPEMPSASISEEQQWYNQHPLQNAARESAPSDLSVEPYPGQSSPPSTGPVAPLVSGFRIALPPGGPPWIVPPLDSVVVDVTFEPTAYKQYTTKILIDSNDQDEASLELTVTGTGQLDYLHIAPETSFETSGHPGGPFTTPSKTYTLSNTGPSPITWTATKTAAWLDDVVPSGGTLNPSQPTEVVVSLNAAQAAGLPEGTYTDTLTFTNTTSGVVQTRSVRLIVQSTAKIWVDPLSIDVTVAEGGGTTAALTIGNAGDADLTFKINGRETSRSVVPAKSATLLASGGSAISLEYEFPKPTADKQGQSVLLTMPGLEQYLEPGAPIVPVRPVTVLIPYGKQLVNVRTTPLATADLPDTAVLAHAQDCYPLSHPELAKAIGPDPTIYGQATPWPGEYHRVVGVHSKRGYQLLTINLFPLQYVPATGKISYCSRMRVDVDLADGAKVASVVRPTPAVQGSITSKVENPEAINTYPRAAMPTRAAAGPLAQIGGGPAMYVIITNAAIENTAGPWNLQDLRDAKINWGVSATIVTTEWIFANYSGTRPSGGEDNQTRIRNFLIDAYQNWGTRYALLAGTNSIIPARMFNVIGDDIPADMYYGGVDPAACSFDYNANGIYGEKNDGVNGGDVDLYADIYVGRAPVANATEVQNFVRKTLTYDRTQSAYLPNISMLGEYLGFGGVSDYATESMEQVRLGSCADSYCTTGFANHTRPDFYDFDTSQVLYDSPSYSWPKSALISLMNSNIHVFNHLGHANETYCMKLYTSDLSGLTNTDSFFVYSQGCYPGAFDYSDCFAEVLTTMSKGAFATIMNSRYGWGRGNSTDGPSQRFDRQFWDAVLAENILEMGRANADSKEDNTWGISDDIIRWCYYELTLFGDPHQSFRFIEGCPWLTPQPDSGTVPPQQQTTVTLNFNSVSTQGDTLLPGTYTADLLITSNDPDVPVTTATATMTVTSDAMSLQPTSGFKTSGLRGGPFYPSCMTYTLTNTGTQPMDWTAAHSQNWVDLSLSGGTLEAGESVAIQICLNYRAYNLSNGTYNDTLTITNLSSGNTRQRSLELVVGKLQYFTELFDAQDNDLDNLQLAFAPDNSANFYRVCQGTAAAFPTDPAGGTPLALGDDTFTEVALAGGAQVQLYGTSYSSFFVGSNGYITFGSGDDDRTPTLADHFRLPRISGLFDDLAPSAGGAVSWKQLADRVAVTFENVPRFFESQSTNSFQMEMFFDGQIRLTWLNVNAEGGLAGLSAGLGTPANFTESDLSGYGPCYAPVDVDHDGDVDMNDFARFQACLSGRGVPQNDLACKWAKLDTDSDVDREDMVIFRRCLTGEHIPADQHCAE